VSRSVIRFALAALLAATAQSAIAASPQIERGKYLVIVGGCGDCHTPGGLTGKPDATRFLGGSDVGFAIPGQGVFVGRNLTPDKATGLGDWTEAQIAKVMTTGERPDGRVLAPVMPWRALSKLTQSDALAIVAYLRSLPPVKNAVAGPFGPDETPTTLVMTVLPGDAFAKLPKP
jgi:mono/diheme cytochrome c family protein